MPRKKKVDSLVEEVFNEILDKPIGEETEEAIIDAASYLNCERALASVEDGCKTSYRRLIWSALQFPKGELQPSTKLINGMASTHGHSLVGVEPLLAAMVKSGIMTGSGSFGIKSILGSEYNKDAASPRYTKTRISDLYYEVIKPGLQCIPLVESEVGALEPKKLSLVFPLCLSFRSLVSGIGYGISTVYPNFSPTSMYEALMKDDPSYLEPNINLLLDKKNSELKELWTTGKGRVIYSYRLSRYVNEDGRPGYLFEGDASIFAPNLKKIDKYVESGQVFIEDMTDKNGPKMFVGLVSSRGSLDISALEKLCRQCCFDATTYQLNVTDGNSAFRIPLRDWLRYTYQNFIDISTEVNKRQIKKVEFDIKVQEALPFVSDYIIKNPKASDSELCQASGLSADIIAAIISKPIGYLRKSKDNEERIRALKSKLRELKHFDPGKYAEEVIKMM